MKMSRRLSKGDKGIERLEELWASNERRDLSRWESGTKLDKPQEQV